MPGSKTLLLSDIHLSTEERYLHAGHEPEYKPHVHTPRLTGFLNRYLEENESNLHEVVLLGDILDIWACPADQTPPTVHDIAESNPDVIDAFNDITAQGIALRLVKGNHDICPDTESFDTVFNDITIDTQYLNDNIFAVHGHKHDFLNTFDDPANLVQGLPIGYFMTRFGYSIHEGRDVNKMLLKNVPDITRRIASRENIHFSILNIMSRRAGFHRRDHVVLPNDASISVGSLIDQFADIGSHYSIPDFLHRLDFQLLPLYTAALFKIEREICIENGYRVVISGHTHEPHRNRDRLDSGWIACINTGAWFSEDLAQCVEIDHEEPVTVSLLEVDASGEYSSPPKWRFTIE